MQTLGVVGTQLGRRRFLMVAGAAAGSAILAACGGSTATDTPKAAAPTTAAPTTAAASAATATRPVGSSPASTTAASNAAATIAPVATTAPAASSVAVATRPAGSAVASSVSATTASGSAAAGTSGIQTMVIEAFDYGFRTLGSIPGGQTRVQMKNTGKEIHHTQFMLLNPGVTTDQLGAAFAKGEQGLGEVFGLVTQTGGVGVIPPGASAEVILNLKEGQYMLACFIAGDDHIPHLAKGMLMPLKVTAAPAAASPAPAVNGTITLVDFNFTMPDTLPAGKSMYTVTNTGAQFHEFTISQLAPGKTLADAKAFFDPVPNTPPPAGPPPIIPVGGMNALSKGNSGIVVLDLKPGDYVAACNVPDQSKPNGDSHVHLGMIKGFTVK
ncbi:MAG: hypothetical protein M3Z19_11840 [Chloroflexota bacterium]|nr:hypothetical protein [Chloroflexota bacterium]